MKTVMFFVFFSFFLNGFTNSSDMILSNNELSLRGGPFILSKDELRNIFHNDEYHEHKGEGVVMYTPRLREGEIKELCEGVFATAIINPQTGALYIARADQIYVRFKDHKTRTHENARNFLRSVGSDIQPNFWASEEHAFLAKVPDSMTVPEFVEFMNKLPDIDYAEPEPLNFIHYTPNDPNYSQQWHHSHVQTPDAWNITFGDPSIVHMISDSGVSLYNHPGDSYISPGKNYVVSEELGHIAADRDTYEHDPGGDRNPILGDNIPRDDQGHGTSIANLIHGEMDNNKYGTGIAWKLKILPYKAVTCNGLISRGYQSIDFGRTGGAHVINMSWGNPFSSGFNTTNNNTCNAAWDAGILLVSSSGNSGDDTGTDWQNGWPASYVNVLSIGATTSTKARASFSCYGWGATAGYQGTETSELFAVAPGQSLYNLQMQYAASGCGTADPENQTWGSYTTGTSFSSPIAAALGALCYVLGATNPANVRAYMANNADHTSGGRVNPTASSAISGANTYSETYGHGMVQFADTLNQIVPAPYIVYHSKSINDSVGGNGNGIPEPGESVRITVTLENKAAATLMSGVATFSSVDYYVQAMTDNTSNYLNIAGGATRTASDPFEFLINAYTPNLHDIEFSMTITGKFDSGNKDYSATRTFKVTVGSTPIIIIEASSGARVAGYSIKTEDRIGNALSQLNWLYAHVDNVPADLSSPRFKMVFVCSGNYAYYSPARSKTGDYQQLSPTNIASLTNFVQTGGNLYFEGAGQSQRYSADSTFWGLFGTGFTANTTRNYETGNIRTVQGVAAGTVGVPLAGSDRAYENNTDNPGWGAYTDSYNTPLSPTTATTAVRSTGAQGTNLVRVVQRAISGQGKVIWSDILFGGIIPTENLSTLRRDYMDYILDFFGETTNPADTTPPAKPTINMVLNKFVGGKGTAYWITPGDDGMNGQLTNANPYQMRYQSGTTINWASATIHAGAPASASSPGDPASMAINVGVGTFTFQLQVSDEAGNWVRSDPLTVEFPAAPCGDYTGPLWLLAIWPERQWYQEWKEWERRLSGNQIIFDVAFNTLPADLTGYSAILNVAGSAANWNTPGYQQIATAGHPEQQKLTTYHNATGHLAFIMGWNSILWEQHDYQWINNVCGLALNGDFSNNHGDGDYQFEAVETTVFGVSGNLTSYNSSFVEGICDYFTGERGLMTLSYRTSVNVNKAKQDKIACRILSDTRKRVYGSFTLIGFTNIAHRNGMIINFKSCFGFPTITDTCRPSEIDDLSASLAATAGQVWLLWSAPGNDARIGGGSGICTAYAVKRSANPIRVDDHPYTQTTTNFNAATNVTGTIPTPEYPGTPQQMLVTGLTAGNAYYFNIRAADEGPRYSYSNDAYIRLPSGAIQPRVLVIDQTRPGMCTWTFMDQSSTWDPSVYEGLPTDYGIPGEVRAAPVARILRELGYGVDYIKNTTLNRRGAAAYLTMLGNYDVVWYLGFTWDVTDKFASGDHTNIYNYLVNSTNRSMYFEDNYACMYSGYPNSGDPNYVEDIWWDSFGAEWGGFTPSGNTGGIRAFEGTEGFGITTGMKFKYPNQSSLDYNNSFLNTRNPQQAVDILQVAEVASRFPTNVEVGDNFMVARYGAHINVRTVISGTWIVGLTPYDDNYATNGTPAVIKNIMTFFGYGGNVGLSEVNLISMPLWEKNAVDGYYISSSYGSSPALYRINNLAWGEYNNKTHISRVGTNLHHSSTITVDDFYIYYARSVGYDDSEGMEIYRLLKSNTQNPVTWYPAGIVGGYPLVVRWYDPDYSPGANFVDGAGRIAASHSGEIVVYKADGTINNATTKDVVRLTGLQGNIQNSDIIEPKMYQPKWSPDGNMVAFVYRPAGPTDQPSKSGIYVINNVKALMTAQYPVYIDNWVKTLTDSRVIVIYPHGKYPSWSPSFSQDGSIIAFSLDTKGTFNNRTYRTTTGPYNMLPNTQFAVYKKEVMNFPQIPAPAVASSGNEAFVQWAPEGGNKMLQASRTITDNRYKLIVYADDANVFGGWTTKSGNPGTVVSDYSNSKIRFAGDITNYGFKDIRIKANDQKIPIPNGYEFYGASRKIETEPYTENMPVEAEFELRYNKFSASNFNPDTHELRLFHVDNDKLTQVNATFLDTAPDAEYQGVVYTTITKQGVYAIFAVPLKSSFSDLKKVAVFPNPVNARKDDRTEGVAIAKLPNDINAITIYTIAGEKVATLKNAVLYWKTGESFDIPPAYQHLIDEMDPTAVAYWDLTNDDGNSVASGVYIITIIRMGETIYKKVAVIK